MQIYFCVLLPQEQRKAAIARAAGITENEVLAKDDQTPSVWGRRHDQDVG